MPCVRCVFSIRLRYKRVNTVGGSKPQRPSSTTRSKKYNARPLICNQRSSFSHCLLESVRTRSHSSGKGSQNVNSTARRLSCTPLNGIGAMLMLDREEETHAFISPECMNV